MSIETVGEYTFADYRRRPAALWKQHPEWILSPILLVVVLLAWEGTVRLLNVPVFLVPPPSAVVESLVKGLTADPASRSGYPRHILITLQEAMAGFALGSLAGILIGTVLAQFRLVQKIVLPYIVAFQSIPKVGLAPLFVIWFGFGMTSKIVTAAILTFFPLLINSMAGFSGVPQERVDLLRSVNASNWRIFRMVKFPSALPFIFAGLDLGIIYSFLGAIVGEFVGAQGGLGVLLISMQSNLDVKGAFSLFVISSAIGVTLHLIVVNVQRRVLFWAPGVSDNISA